MDFIFNDLEQNQAWKAFTAPALENHQPWVPPEKPVVKIAQSSDWCSGELNSDICTTKGDQNKLTFHPVFGGGGGGDSANDGHSGTTPLGVSINLEAALAQEACLKEPRDEADVDAAIQAAADEIRALNTPEDNPNNNEFGVLAIKLPDGSVVYAIPTEGITGSVSLDQMLADAQAEFGANINGSDIVGILHSHPSSLGTGFNNVPLSALPPVDQQATMPSHHLIGGIQRGANGLRATDPVTGHALLLSEMWDWGTGRRFLTRNGNANVGSVSHYILGPDGVLREYDYSEQHPAENVEQVELINDAEQDADSKCE